ncbi:glycosyltransferase family 2 protein [Poseidonocella sedimentorum]|uniref:Glycosyl transferase family 2 n=1 Tax=Poseidonocella sedimentorum TaxID=871652 RepID=A0A1I6ECW8_9RHOB|nr:glycosyltransferase family 2 protein [Poseidonocella sedimentorum]SFR15599.1 Glycosyl transferase family 2 [Poseidonocella sedimentorum]
MTKAAPFSAEDRQGESALVSVIMPAWCAAPWLERAVLSVRNQTRTDWELFIVDDASTDDTAAIATRLARDDPRIRLLAQPRRSGAAQARNRAISQAAGRYIAFLDADDCWLPEKLETQIAFMERVGAGLSYTGFWRARGEKRREVAVPESVDHAALLRGNIIGCLTAVYDRERLGTRLMPDLPLRQDYALWLEILRELPRAHGLTTPLAVHHATPGSLSSRRLRAAAATWQVYRREGLGRGAASLCLGRHLLRRLARG